MRESSTLGYTKRTLFRDDHRSRAPGSDAMFRVKCGEV